MMKLTKDEWSRVRELMGEVAELPPGERSDYLAGLADSPLVVDEVRSLLAAFERNEGAFEVGGAAEDDGVEDEADEDQLIGRRIGPYRLVSRLGYGGMGVVYLAERDDQEYDKQVAIKLVWPGLHSAGVVRRFRRERQILANLDHPNIARMLEGGTTLEGWPYIVIEYVDGVPITEYCDRERLGLAERLRLFVMVCHAVEYAHKHGVIHRDLKPGNILVTGDGVAKLLDFGIARLLEGQPTVDLMDVTATVNLILTPPYASPEQLTRQPVGSASDVYSLGVILYRLLAGRLPYRGEISVSDDLLRAIREGYLIPLRKAIDTTSPITAREVTRDLEMISLRALAADHRQRYASPLELVADIERFLAREPVLAATRRGGAWIYRTRKLLERHRLASGALAVLLFLLLIPAVWGGQWLIGWSRQRGQLARQAEIMRAIELIADGRREEAHAIIDRPGSADFERDYLSRQLETSPIALREDETIDTLWFTKDQNLLVTVSGNQSTLRVRDPADWQVKSIYREPGHNLWMESDRQFSMRVVVDGNHLLLSDLRTGQQVGRCTDPTSKDLIEVGQSPLITLNERGIVRVWDWSTCRSRVLDRIEPESLNSTIVNIISNDKRIFLLNTVHRILIWDLRTLRRVADIERPAGVIHASLSADGRMAAVLDNDLETTVINTITGRIEHRFSQPEPAATVWLSPDAGTLLVANLNGSLLVRDLRSGEALATLNGHSSSVRRVIFFDSGRKVASLCEDGVLCIWQTNGYRELATYRVQPPGFPKMDISRDEQWLATAGIDNLVRVWKVSDLLPGGALLHHRDHVFSVTFSPDQRLLAMASGDGTISLTDLSTRALSHRLIGHSQKVFSVAFSADGSRLVSSGSDNTARIWEVATGRELLKITHPDPGQIHSAQFSPDGSLIATVSARRLVYLWNAQTGALVRELDGHDGEVFTVAFSRDGRVVASGGEDQTVRLWRVADGRQIVTLRGHKKPLWSVVFSPDGLHLASAARDSTVILWSLNDWRQVQSYNGHRDEVFEVAFSPDGRRLATAGKDKSVRIWETVSGLELLRLERHSQQIWSVAFSPDGRMLASGSWDGKGWIY